MYCRFRIPVWQVCLIIFIVYECFWLDTSDTVARLGLLCCTQLLISTPVCLWISSLLIWGCYILYNNQHTSTSMFMWEVKPDIKLVLIAVGKWEKQNKIISDHKFTQNMIIYNLFMIRLCFSYYGICFLNYNGCLNAIAYPQALVWAFCVVFNICSSAIFRSIIRGSYMHLIIIVRVPAYFREEFTLKSDWFW